MYVCQKTKSIGARTRAFLSKGNAWEYLPLTGRKALTNKGKRVWDALAPRPPGAGDEEAAVKSCGRHNVKKVKQKAKKLSNASRKPPASGQNERSSPTAKLRL